MTESFLQEKLNKILVDIVSVTDDVRMEQLRDEYLEVESALLEQKDQTKIQCYKDLYKICSFTEAIECTNNINISEICKMYKLRELTSLDNTRVLTPFLSACNATLIIKDMEGIVIDNIGKGEKEYNVYVYCLSKYKLDMTPCVLK